MKKIIAFAFVTILSTFALAEVLTYTEIVFTKDNKDENGLFYLGSPLKKWCDGITTVAQFSSFEAAQYVESMDNGFYLCEGKFLSAQHISPMQIFSVTKCTAQNPAVLKERCQ